MEAVHRSDSALSFSPGPHRRSHPTLQHLSLAPLTPKYPISPSDYDAYVDPLTSQLHTSSSLNYMSSRPSPGGFFSDPASQSQSKTGRRKSKSSVSMRHAGGVPRGALTSEGMGGKLLDPTDLETRQRPSGKRMGPKRNDSSWLLQTGMALTEGSRESKGQSWMAKRASSISLHSPTIEDYPRSPDYRQARSEWDALTRSRRGSGSRGRRKSRRDLVMTPAAYPDLSAPGDNKQGGSPAPPTFSMTASTHDCAVVEPDWADAQTQAEIAADLEMQCANELEDGELYSNDGDRYDSRDFEGRSTEEEEHELQQAVQSHGFRLGNWIDGVVDVFLKMDDIEEEDAEVEQGKVQRGATTVPLPGSQEPKRSGPSKREESGDPGSTEEIEPAPQNPSSVWEDVAWFGRFVFRTAKT